MAPAFALLLFFLASILILQSYAEFHLHSKSLPPDQQLVQDSLLKEMERAHLKLSSLEKSLLEKDTDLFAKEKIISSLKDKLDGIQKGGSKEIEAMLDRTLQESKQLARQAAELEEVLNGKELKLSKLQERAQKLEEDGKTHMSQHEDLEIHLRERRKLREDLEISLQAAREAVKQVAAKYDAKTQELKKAHTQWLPPWASKHFSHLQVSLSSWWTTQARPLIYPVFGKNAEQDGRSVLKEWWKVAHLKCATLVATFKEHAIEGFDVTRAFIVPQLKKAQYNIQKTIQVARDSCSPYMDKASAAFQPYFNRVQVLCKPYTEKLTQNFNKYMKYATKKHLQLQRKIRKALKKNKYLASIASKEVVWLLASTLLIMPLYGLLMLLSVLFGDRKQSTHVKGAVSHRHRKAKHSRHVNK